MYRLLIVCLLILSSCKKEAPQKEYTLAEKIANAHGFQNWDKVKEFHFSFTFDPENNASFTDGKEQLKQYLKEKAIDKIPADSFENYNLAAIKFTVTEEGEITNVHVFDSAYQGFKNEYINSLLIETVQNMPCWKPAEYSDGTKVKQDFILAAGDMRSCFVNLLNIRKLAIEE